MDEDGGHWLCRVPLSDFGGRKGLDTLRQVVVALANDKDIEIPDSAGPAGRMEELPCGGWKAG